VIALSAAISVGCAAGSTDSSEVPDTGDLIDGFVDTGLADTGGDESSTDATTDTGGGDAVGDGDASPGCKTNADCVSDPAGKFCLPSTDGGKSFCVPCLPAPFDECGAGTYCSDMTYTCEEGCKTTADCKPGSGGDAGADGGADGATDGDVDGASDGATDAPGSESGASIVCDAVKHRCVGCVDDPDCPAGFLCDRPAGTCIPGCNATHPCATGKDCCAGSCVDTKKDTKNCGTCGNTCSAPANASAGCNDGTCGIGTCNSGYGDCNTSASDGCEVNLSSNKDNCGACGMACMLSNATAACVGGSCGIATCNGGYDDCDKIAATGCETSLKTISDCGGCGKLCTIPNGTGQCTTGTCQVATCNAGYGDCDGLAANGCETNTAGGTPGPGSTILNCGTCGTSCSVTNGTPLCASGTCKVASCAAPYDDCDGVYANGCETNTNNSVGNCGACGTICSGNHGAASCAGGLCGITCNPGYGNCDGSILNGCEDNTSSDINNCGMCGTKCSLTSHALSTGCASSACSVATCESDYYDRNKSYADGCECQGDGVGDSCGAALDLGTVALGGSVTKIGNLAGSGTSDAFDEDWYKITFSVGPSCSYHPRVAVTGDPNVKIAIYTGCAGSSPTGNFSCTEGGSSTTALTSWELTMSATCGAQQSIDPYPQTTGAFLATSNVVFVRVVRTGSTPTCYPYTLTIGN
jgi:hypothetical protein